MKFIFTHDKQSISRVEFERNAPANWIELVDHNGYYTWGYYSAQKIDQ
jgi:hypothetical protein